MGAKKKAAKAGAAATAVKESPAVQRLITDDEVRDQIKVAYDASRDAYGRLTNGKGLSKALMDDKKLHSDLQTAAEALREAGSALKQGPVKKRKKGGLGRFLLFAIVGGGLAMAVSSDLRSKVLDALFGAEEEFDYTSTTTPSSAPSTPSPAGSTT